VDETALKHKLLAVAAASGRQPTPADIGAEVARILANREIAATMAAIRDAGSEVRYLAVDVRDATALTAAFDELRREWGPITGVIHGAGVLADKRISDKTASQFDSVFDTKVEGLRALLSATANDPLSLLFLFSSITARTGNVGQSDYAMANEVLNAVGAAEYRRRNGQCLVRAIGWGPWEGGMVTPALRAHFERQGVALIPLEVGARAMVDEMQSMNSDEVELILAAENGASRQESNEQLSASMEIDISATRHAYLTSHCIEGKPVVPLALAVEWLMRCVQSCRPKWHVVECRDIEVFRGIRLDLPLSNKRWHFTALCRAVQPGSDMVNFHAELRGEGNALHYAGTIGIAVHPLPGNVKRLPTAMQIDAWNERPIYDGHVLFHGPAFQAIRSVIGVSEQGCVGMLVGGRALGWADEGWSIDVAAFDGALQLALLWAQSVLGGAALPTAVGLYRHYERALPEGEIRCVVHGGPAQGERAICDIELFAADGALIAEIGALELHLRPGENRKTYTDAVPIAIGAE
jgi:NAD(P)-dependent dehydrogenase (short-subunit alcohol dehydrogenase family)